MQTDMHIYGHMDKDNITCNWAHIYLLWHNTHAHRCMYTHIHQQGIHSPFRIWRQIHILHTCYPGTTYCISLNNLREIPQRHGNLVWRTKQLWRESQDGTHSISCDQTYTFQTFCIIVQIQNLMYHAVFCLFNCWSATITSLLSNNHRPCSTSI